MYSTGAPDIGGTCVNDDLEPGHGFATYPPGLVPEYFDDTIDCSKKDCGPGPLGITCPHNYPKAPCMIGDHALPLPTHR